MVAVGAAKAMKTLASNDLFTDFPIIQSYYRPPACVLPGPSLCPTQPRLGTAQTPQETTFRYRDIGGSVRIRPLPVTAITGVPCRRILPSVNTNGAFRNMQSEALAARADRALQRHRELRMEFDMLLVPMPNGDLLMLGRQSGLRSNTALYENGWQFSCWLRHSSGLMNIWPP